MNDATGKRRFRSLVPAVRGSVCIVVGLTIACLVLYTVFGISERALITMLVSLTAVIGIGTFSGNSGVLSFGHAAFIGIGAYVAGILTVPPALKETALPNLPSWLASTEYSPELALIVAVVIGLVFGAVSAAPIVRLPRGTGSIATLGLLIFVHAMMLGASDFTRGAQSFYGVPTFTTLPIAAGVAVITIVCARIFRESVFGLGLRASNDDEMGAKAMGVNIPRLRFYAWTLSAGMAAASGALLGFYLGAFSPKEFYFTTTFTLLAMLIVGGMRTVSGAVAGTVLVTLVLELAREAEPGFDVGSIAIPGITGLTTIALAAMLLVVMYTKADGLFGGREVDELIMGRWRRRGATEKE